MRLMPFALLCFSLPTPALADDLPAATEPAFEAVPVDTDHGLTTDAMEPPPGLADLDGLPQVPAQLGTADEIRSAPGASDPTCKEIPAPLRAMAFRHFLNFQKMQNEQGRYFPPEAATRAAKALGMVLKESSGDPAAVADMKGKSKTTYKPETTVANWKALLTHKHITYNKQTNFGLLQMSMDRLVVAFKINSQLDDFLPGEDAASTSALNTRRLLDFYQDFAQGRLEQGDTPIPAAALRDPKASPELKERARKGAAKALYHCGTRFLYKEGQQGAEGQKALEDAMMSIAYCDPGIDKPDTTSRAQLECFARWVTLCPALNLDIAINTPKEYFETRKAPPKCEATFRALITKKP